MQNLDTAVLLSSDPVSSLPSQILPRFDISIIN